jgi:hypothetical protein
VTLGGGLPPPLVLLFPPPPQPKNGSAINNAEIETNALSLMSIFPFLFLAKNPRLSAPAIRLNRHAF